MEDRVTSRSRSTFFAVAGLLFAAYGALLASNISFAVGGSDSSAYANTAKLLASGRITTRVDPLERFGLPDRFLPVFLPLGFVPGPEPRTMAPFYPVGMSLHMAAAGLLAGWGLGPFLVSPLAALGCIVLTFLLGRELSLSRWMSLGGAAILGGCAVFLFQSLQPMSDVLAAFWCAGAALAALRARSRPGWATAAGAAFGLAVLVRPTALILLPALLFALPLSRRALLFFGLGGSLFAAIFLGYNEAAYGHPFRTGYVAMGIQEGFALRNFPARFLYYTSWLARMLSPLIPLGWLALPAVRSVPLRDRAILLSGFASFLLLYCFYEPYAAWWYTRFLLPALPFLILGALLAAREAIARVTAGTGARRVAALLFVGTSLAVAWDRTDDLGVLGVDEGQKVIPESCSWAEQALPRGSLVAASEMSGALRYYTNLTPVRWDALEPASFLELRARTEASGARWFALLLAHEAPLAAAKMPGNWTFVGERGPVSLWRLEP